MPPRGFARLGESLERPRHSAGALPGGLDAAVDTPVADRAEPRFAVEVKGFAVLAGKERPRGATDDTSAK